MGLRSAENTVKHTVPAVGGLGRVSVDNGGTGGGVTGVGPPPGSVVPVLGSSAPQVQNESVYGASNTL